MTALMWISQSERPMSPEELCHALGVQIASTDPNPENIPSIESLLASCLGLVIVDKEESTVRMVHFTFQEYLNSSSEMFQNSYGLMAEVCLTYRTLTLIAFGNFRLFWTMPHKNIPSSNTLPAVGDTTRKTKPPPA